MYWILRRTGAANFFNSLNNNCSSSKDNGGRYNANGTQDKYVKRPPRKAYGRLSAGDDDAISLELKIDEPFDDLDNFELIGGHSRTGNKNTQNGNCVESKALTPLANQMDSFGNLKEVQCTPTDCQKNFVAESDLCDLNLCNNNSTGSIFPMNSSTAIERRQKELDKNTINRLHMMAMSDDDDYVAAVATVSSPRSCCSNTIKRNSNTGAMMNQVGETAVVGIRMITSQTPIHIRAKRRAKTWSAYCKWHLGFFFMGRV